MKEIHFNKFMDLSKRQGKVLICGEEGAGKTLLSTYIGIEKMLMGVQDCWKSYERVDRYNDLGYNFSKNYIYILEIRRRKDFILEDLGIVKNQKLQNLPEAYLLDDENSVKAYLRGVFLAVGSINDPKTSRYHLEFVVNDSIYANFLKEKLNLYDLNSKVLKRENKYMVYIKEAEKISDFLRLIGASNAVLYYEEIRIFRNQKNNTNRLNNCEQANVDKMIETANHQIHDIQILEEAGLLDVMDEKLLDVCTYRKKYPEVSLQELSEIITLETGKKITKSGVHHRLKKISEMASNLSQK